jgi:hypothetical protein
LLSQYKITKSESGFYIFKTKNNIKYCCSFIEDTNFYGLPLKSKVFSFSFWITNEPKNIPLDITTGKTIAGLIESFLEKNPTSLITYICDNSDNKGIKRLFNFSKWFSSNNPNKEKILFTISILDVIYSGTILKSSNPEKQKIKKYLSETVINSSAEISKENAIQEFN